MPQPHTLKINEIFYSLQGEGLRQGEPTVFIRLSGCNLKCDFCDTQYAWDEGRDLSADQICFEVKDIRRHHPSRWICLTGGEPLYQDIASLTQRLKMDKWNIQVETNGIFYQDLPVDWYTVSPKPKEYFVHAKYTGSAKEVKLVVTRELEMETVKNIRKYFPEQIPLFLQAQSNLKWSLDRGIELVEHAAGNNLDNIRLSVQLHKILGLP
ncbi:MAG: 7-carboxy-7-deazaguanine synthase QueE [Candidatus Aminicenantaceae bacterium]